MKYKLDQSILRQYDIRGEIEKTLFFKDAFFIGKAFASIVKKTNGRCIAVARDGRLSSPKLCDSLISGIISEGIDVNFIGLTPTPMLYFAVHELDLDGGIMVTGSHNPKNHNGFKITMRNEPFYGDDIKNLAKIIESQQYCNQQNQGSIYEINLYDKYIDRVFKDIILPRPMNVAWDCGNGAAGAVIDKLSQRIHGKHILLNQLIDGNFPARSPDPTVPENLSVLQKTILENNCDLGIAFDGDADRLSVIDNKGRIILGDQLLFLMAKDVLSKKPGVTIIADVKTSQVFFEEIKLLGGTPIMSPTGHSLIKAKMYKTKAALAGEMSGHIFFADQWYGFDDGLYSAVRLVAFLSSQSVPLSVMLDELPKMFNTPEIRINCSDDKKFNIIKAILEELNLDQDLKIETMDGIRVTTEHGWWLLRASNTQEALVARIEANTEDHLNKLKIQLWNMLSRFGVKL